MEKITNWTGVEVDSAFYLQMQDLTTVLAHNSAFTFVHSYGSYVDLVNRQITGSSFWDVPHEDIKTAGYRTDVMLRTAGTMRESDIPALQAYVERFKKSAFPQFSMQLVTCLEDLRLENIVRKRRPGTKRDFTIRMETMKHYFRTQVKVNAMEGDTLDELFCLIYLRIHADEPDPDFSGASETQTKHLEKIQPLLFDSFTAESTRDITLIAERIVMSLEADSTDMRHDYVVFPIKHLESVTERTLFDELTRTDPLANEDEEDVDPENNEYIDESFSTRHRENENSDRKQNMLQFELDVGTKTDLMGGNIRETNEGDDATASVQGSSGESEKNDYSEKESLSQQETSQGEKTEKTVYGRDNKHAVAIVKPTTTPSIEDKKLYETFVEDIDPYRRKLASTIEKTLEHKRNAPHKNMLFGRLSQDLLPLVIDDSPRVFYKKTFESNEVDAVFTLLVDCSASMYNKMEETKRGIVLFHEVLDQLHIPHSIVGFWEDANPGTDTYHRNYFHYVQRFRDTPYENSGARIMQLESEEDNRDGFSIRVMTEELVKRREKNKFLLVFSDGEPAAMNYDQNGIVDTNVAVAEARKKGLDVIGMFLADGEISEQEEATMNNIYGKEHLTIPNVAELPEMFAPLLKKLLLRGV